MSVTKIRAMHGVHDLQDAIMTDAPGKRVPIVGIAGGIASGKSFVTELLRHKGAAVVVADQAAHDVLKLEEVKRAVREQFGPHVFGSDGQIERSELGKVVFAPPPDGPRQLRCLEQITHPRIREILRKQVEQLAAEGTATAIVLDVPLLFESGWNELCDQVLFVDAPLELRQARAGKRGWSQEEFARREAAQQSPAHKRQQADVVIDNSGSAESTRQQIDQWWPPTIQGG